MAEATSNQLRVRLVTPERTLFEADASAVELPSKIGLHGSALRARAADGRAGRGRRAHSPGRRHRIHAVPRPTRYNVSWGFVEVLPNRVTILANDALKPEEIDVPRAEQQLDRGEKMWKEAGESEEAYDEALRVISEAEAKIASAGESVKAH